MPIASSRRRDDDLSAALEADHEMLVVVLVDAQHDGVDELDAERATGLASARAQLGRADRRRARDSR